MKEFIALLAVANGCFILGSFFGAGVYHAILTVFKKGESEVKDYIAALKAKEEAAKNFLNKAVSNIEDGLPHT